MLFFCYFQADFTNAKFVLNMNDIRLKFKRKLLSHVTNRECNAVFVKLFKQYARNVNNSIFKLGFALFFGADRDY